MDSIEVDSLNLVEYYNKWDIEDTKYKLYLRQKYKYFQLTFNYYIMCIYIYNLQYYLVLNYLYLIYYLQI